LLSLVLVIIRCLVLPEYLPMPPCHCAMAPHNHRIRGSAVACGRAARAPQATG